MEHVGIFNRMILSLEYCRFGNIITLLGNGKYDVCMLNQMGGKCSMYFWPSFCDE